MIFAGVIAQIISMKKPLTGGETLPNHTRWKETTITKVLRSTFNGGAFTTFVFCLSQAKKNGGEGYATMKLAEMCSKIRTNVTRPKPFKYDKMVQEFTNSMEKDKQTIKAVEKTNRKDPTAIILRENMIFRA